MTRAITALLALAACLYAVACYRLIHLLVWSWPQ